MNYFPAFFDLKERPVLLVGGGQAAARRLRLAPLAMALLYQKRMAMKIRLTKRARRITVGKTGAANPGIRKEVRGKMLRMSTIDPVVTIKMATPTHRSQGPIWSRSFASKNAP